eukprot:CAMPEP_0170071360 /NCGR_PEP_ID=MMETSP0019_2-20121128/9322_1 /TAXON_ID=98059 /ORGANISM="Dinobryon sp., Strain UTEXLB2267" /LENGTH=31 /DNA_ID= /DNA_START= /DNA_END= /DNA_ORIENTATION=
MRRSTCLPTSSNSPSSSPVEVAVEVAAGSEE